MVDIGEVVRWQWGICYDGNGYMPGTLKWWFKHSSDDQPWPPSP